MTESRQWNAVKVVASLIREGDAKGLPGLQWTIQTPDHRGDVTVVGRVEGEPGELLDPDEARQIWERWTRFARAETLPEATLQTFGQLPQPKQLRLESRVEQAGGGRVMVRIIADLVDLFTEQDPGEVADVTEVPLVDLMAALGSASRRREGVQVGLGKED